MVRIIFAATVLILAAHIAAAHPHPGHYDLKMDIVWSIPELCAIPDSKVTFYVYFDSPEEDKESTISLFEPPMVVVSRDYGSPLISFRDQDTALGASHTITTDLFNRCYLIEGKHKTESGWLASRFRIEKNDNRNWVVFDDDEDGLYNDGLVRIEVVPPADYEGMPNSDAPG